METEKSFSAPAARGMQRTVRVALLVLSAVGVLAIVAGMEAFNVTERAVDYQRALEHSIQQQAQLRRVSAMLQDAETSQRGFLLTNDVSYLQRFEALKAEAREPLDRLVDVLSDSSVQASRAERLRRLAMERMRQLSSVLADVGLAEHEPVGSSGAIIHRSRAEAGMQTRSRIQGLLEEMIALEEREIRQASAALSERLQFSRNVLIALIAGIVALVTLVMTLGLVYLAHRRRVEAELRMAMAGAREASEAKTQFLASMSHEIRTPLTGILGYTDLLLEESLTPQQRSYVERLQTAGTSLSALIDDILELSKIEAGEVAIVEEPLSLGVLVANVLSIVSLTAQKKNLDLRSEIDPALPPMVLGDEPRLRQVLLNLLTNAIKFTPQGSVIVQVEHEETSAEGEVIRFAVIDTGIGIAADRRSRLFRRFSQADPSIQHEYGGTGLGLAISKRLVELMGGTIGFESEEDRGSTFWFRVILPRSEAPVGHEDTDAAAATAERARILLVEDSPQNQDLVCAILRREGHEVDVANDGEEALVAARGKAYDLILMDIQMPRMDGVTASRKLRGMEGGMVRVPIIAMTANVLPQQLRSFRKASIDDHIAKPFKKAHLIAKVNQWLSAAARQDALADAGSGSGILHDDQALEALRELMGDAWVRASLVRLRERLDEAFAEASGGDVDREELKRHAHRLVSDAGQLGFRELSEACSALEEACASQTPEELGPALERARRIAERTERAIDQGLSSMVEP